MTEFVSDKLLITKKVLEQITLDYTDLDLDRALSTWWSNKRSSGGLGLTESGHVAFLEAGLEFWDIQEEYHDKPWLTSLTLLRLDRYLRCPYHLFVKKKLIVVRVFDSRIAAMIHLHGGLKYYMNKLN